MSTRQTNPFQTQLAHTISAMQAGDWNSAANLCQKLLKAHPQLAEAHYYRGIIHQHLQQPESAIPHFEKVLELIPNHADAQANLGMAYESLHRPDQAQKHYRHAILSSPNHLQANYNLGRIQRVAGQTDEAINSLTRALTSSPESISILLELGLAHKGKSNLSAAQKHLENAKNLEPGNPIIHNVLGNLYQSKGEIASAITSYRQAIQLRPDFAEAYNNLGSALLARGAVNAALEQYQAAVQYKPDWSGAKSNLLLAENYRSSNQKNMLALHKSLGSSINTINPGIQQTCRAPARHTNNKIRIGYLSPDFRYHSVAYFIKPLLRHHNQDNFSIIGFSDCPSVDGMTTELQSLTESWCPVYGLDDNQLYQLINQQKIDILVDLAGHTANNRMGVFAAQAAPIQINYLGYPNTTGIQAVQYRLTDQWADPVGEADTLHTEKLLRIPNGFLCYTPLPDCPDVSVPPQIRNGFTTYGSFNVLAKISDECLEAWCRILQGVPESRLIIKSAGLQDPDTRTFISGRFKALGLDPERIELIARTSSYQSHMELYNRIDISLDTFPYNGTTTTCESLWMGVPVITLAGSQHAGRVGNSLLHQTGLTKYIANHIDAYVNNAISLADDLQQQTGIRASLRTNMSASPLCNGAEFTQAVETIYRNIALIH